jgi:hypothetical protein
MKIDKEDTEKLFKRERMKGYELKETRELVCRKKWI